VRIGEGCPDRLRAAGIECSRGRRSFSIRRRVVVRGEDSRRDGSSAHFQAVHPWLARRGGMVAGRWHGYLQDLPPRGVPGRSVGVVGFGGSVPVQGLANAVGPQCVAVTVEVESVRNEQFGSGPALGVEHGGGDVNVGELWVVGGEVLNHLVGALGQGPEVLAGGAGVDGYEVDVGVGQSAVGFADERFEFEEELFGRGRPGAGRARVGSWSCRRRGWRRGPVGERCPGRRRRRVRRPIWLRRPGVVRG